MNSEDKEMVIDFQQESKEIISEAMDLLELVEEEPSEAKRLEDYGQRLDRIMGGARSLSMSFGGRPQMERIGDLAAVCKAVGYKASQIKDQDEFLNICVALLLDASELLDQMLEDTDSFFYVKTVTSALDPGLKVGETLLDRLKWVSEKFGKEYRATVDVKKPSNSDIMTQDDIDELIKKLGG